MTSYDEHQHLRKEDMKARKTADATDRSKINNYRSRSIHSDGNTVTIVRGRIATDPTVNVREAVEIGTEMMKHYESTWPGGFHDTLPNKVRTMAITKKHIQVGSANAVYDSNLNYSRIIGLKLPVETLTSTML